LACALALFRVAGKKSIMSQLTTRLVFSALMCLGSLQPILAAKSNKSDKADAILASAGLKSGSIPGAAVLVIRHGQVAYERGYGVADLDSHRKIDAHTNFRLASVTKQFTAMGIMLLVHDGRLRYEDSLTSIFPDFPAYGRSISIRNLLNHTSGLRDYEDLMPPVDANLPVEQTQIHDVDVLDLLKRQTSTKFSPGTKWEYSNSGYVVLGLIIEKMSGKSYPEFLHDRVFAPLGMDNTVAYVRGKNTVPDRAFGHSFENGSWKQTDQSSTSATLGDGGVYSSLQDLAKWNGALQKSTLLSQEEMRPALQPVDAPGVLGPDNEPAQYGFGWFLNPYKGHRRMWHYGETIGFRTAIQRFVDSDLAVIVLCNRADLNAAHLSLQIAEVFLSH
jgi:CubicO group peptidase (beta-lactamase class C family)